MIIDTVNNALSGLFAGLRMVLAYEQVPADNRTVNGLREWFQQNPHLLPLDAELSALHEEVKAIFEIEDFEKAYESLDKILDERPELGLQANVLIDLLVSNTLAASEENMDNEELEEKIDDIFETNGSEAFSMYFYLQEALDEHLEVSFEDFLNEFLLIQDDDYQDEYEIYEPLLKYQEITDETFPVLVETIEKAVEETELEDVGTAMMAFFKLPKDFELNCLSVLKTDIDNIKIVPVLASFLAYYNGYESVPSYLKFKKDAAE